METRIFHPEKEHNAISEATKLNIPIVAMVDTNCNPDGIDYVIPCNDDAIRSINLISHCMATAVLDGKSEAVLARGGAFPNPKRRTTSKPIPDKGGDSQKPEQNESKESAMAVMQ